MIVPKESKSYNDRLFNGGVRAFFHFARFTWLGKAMKQLNISQGTVMELGCFDGKSLDYLPFFPSRYVGYDANWEGGLELGMQKWQNENKYQFLFCDQLEMFNEYDEKFDFSIALETLEHLPIAELESYIRKMINSTTSYSFVSIPNEIGIVFLLKHLGKRILLAVDEKYSIREVWHATLGNMKKVERVEEGHKGFDYREMITLLKKHAEVVQIKGLPFSWLPLVLNFSIAIVLKPKN